MDQLLLKRKNNFLFLVLLLICSTELFSQEQKKDSIKLPFSIADEKRLSDEDLKDKKEGVYITGIPDISSIIRR